MYANQVQVLLVEVLVEAVAVVDVLLQIAWWNRKYTTCKSFSRK
jgi:hypothetical protein